MEKEQKEYEVGYLLSPLIPEEKLDEEISVLRKAIEDNKGLIMNEARARNQRLAYAIKKVNTAFFGWMRFMIAPEDFLELKASLEKNGNLLRFLAIRIEKENITAKTARKATKKEKPSAEKKEKGEVKQEEIDKKLEEMLKE